jgi:hypothetical protein
MPEIFLHVSTSQENVPAAFLTDDMSLLGWLAGRID